MCSKIYVYLFFDIEDYVTKEADDLPLTAFRILKRYSVPVTCKIVAEKVRRLMQNGRNDVISAISEHDVGYHLDTHSQHPTIYEYLADLDILHGAKEFMAREESGLKLFKETFSKTPSCFGHPGPTWAPHVYPALSEMGIRVYLDETPILNLDDQPYWYCGVLNLNGANRNYIPFDYTFERPKGIDTVKRKFRRNYVRLRRGRGGAISIMFHLHTAINRGFWDEVNYADGKNRRKEECIRPPAQPAEVTERAWKDLEELIRYISTFEDVQFITASDAARIYERPTEIVLPKKRLSDVAKHFRVSSRYLETDSGFLSPAEAFYAVTRSLSEYCDTGSLPEQVALKEPLGPTAPARTKGKKKLVTKDFLASAKAAVQFMESQKHIPNSLAVGSDAELSPHDFLATACKLLRVATAREGIPDCIIVSIGRPPQVNRLNVAAFRSACRWKVLPRNFKAPKIFEQAKLQAWTLKPSTPRPDGN